MRWVLAALSALPAFGCDDASSIASEPDTPVLVDWSKSAQTITGFGASSAWTLPTLSDELSDRLFSVESGIGLSLLRLRISPEGTTSEFATAQKAAARGVGVWAAPWSPPAEWKSNGMVELGGTLEPEHYADWAARLAGFARDLADRGVPLLALSAQNEPGWKAKWETCEWTPTTLASFVGVHLGPALAEAGVDTKLLGPETNAFDNLTAFSDALLEHEAAARYVRVIATHAYGGKPFDYVRAAERGLEYWQTEVSSSFSSPGIDSGMRVAEWLHEHLTVARVNAWHHWWVLPRGDLPDDNSGLLAANGDWTHRAYVLSHWSRFVRPGFVAVPVPGRAKSGVLLSAFRDPEGSRKVLVAVNQSLNPREQPLELSAFDAAELRPIQTSAELALSELPAVAVSDGQVLLELPRRSVTTFIAD